MARTDYYHNPNAPRPNSIVVAVTAFVQDDAGRILMIRRTDNDFYAIPRRSAGDRRNELPGRHPRGQRGGRDRLTPARRHQERSCVALLRDRVGARPLTPTTRC